MKTEVFNLKDGKVEVSQFENIIYFTVYGNFTDDDIVTLTKYTEDFFAKNNTPTIRIWDLTNMSAEQYNLTPAGIDRLDNWADEAKKKWPGNAAYIIGVPDLIFGMSRMYELKTSDNSMAINVIKSVDELPDKIKIKISGKFAEK